MSNLRIIAISILAVVGCGGNLECRRASDCGSGRECCYSSFASGGGGHSTSCAAANSCDTIQGVDTFQSVTCSSDADCKGRVYEMGPSKSTTMPMVCCPVDGIPVCVAGTSCS